MPFVLLLCTNDSITLDDLSLSSYYSTSLCPLESVSHRLCGTYNPLTFFTRPEERKLVVGKYDWLLGYSTCESFELVLNC